MSKKGRKPKIYPQEIIDNIIFQYLKRYKNNGLIKYLDIYRFSEELYKKGESLHHFSEDFWRKKGRQGRETIDKANEVLEHTVSLSTQEDEKVVDSIDAVNKFFQGKESNKEKLIGAIVINENKLKKYIAKNRKITGELANQEKKVTILEQENLLLNQRLAEYEELFFQWLDASSHEDIPLINIITTGKSRNKIVQHLFDTMFNDNPVKGYEKFEEFRKNKRNNQNTNTNTSVVSFRDNKRNTLIDDLNL
ncbi:hypothetical protein [Heyndrickxia ginsengihumi]|uniref:hypothetical protein n=1 Tax=Heyndrickxia ginsengihumi TaxID=363870 RepID=UPI00203FEA57|nr:hypothetical protein [Heyndrickxia ginsengihumi]MCM3023640.1 hypothetical protein [Heyndrickxia ginsengihumi]